MRTEGDTAELRGMKAKILAFRLDGVVSSSNAHAIIFEPPESMNDAGLISNMPIAKFAASMFPHPLPMLIAFAPV